MNLNLSDRTTLDELFAKVDSWSELPAASLNAQQIALINLKNSVVNSTCKNGGAYCFICYSGA